MIYTIRDFQPDDEEKESVFNFVELSNAEGQKMISPGRKEIYGRPDRKYFTVDFKDTQLLNPMTKRPHKPGPNDTLIDWKGIRWGVIELLEERRDKTYKLLVYLMDVEKVWEKSFDRPGREAVS